MATTGERITTQQFYDELIKQNDKREEMERRLNERVDKLIEQNTAMLERITLMNAVSTDNRSEIDRLRNTSRMTDGLNFFIATASGVIAYLMGK